MQMNFENAEIKVYMNNGHLYASHVRTYFG
jgi:hypothetical protein